MRSEHLVMGENKALVMKIVAQPGRTPTTAGIWSKHIGRILGKNSSKRTSHEKYPIRKLKPHTPNLTIICFHHSFAAQITTRTPTTFLLSSKLPKVKIFKKGKKFNFMTFFHFFCARKLLAEMIQKLPRK